LESGVGRSSGFGGLATLQQHLMLLQLLLPLFLLLLLLEEPLLLLQLQLLLGFPLCANRFELCRLINRVSVSLGQTMGLGTRN
jgi:hypothetical protein